MSNLMTVALLRLGCEGARQCRRSAPSGLCHSDDHVATGDMPVGIYPFAGGHDGAGIVTKAGTNTKG
jgi:Zn-dependent alcohol dehydrogenase